MIPKNGANRGGFTLVELLVVVGMIALIMGAFSVSMTSAMQRARIQKATSEVKSLTQAILAYENYMENGDTLTEMTRKEADSTSIGFLLGATSSGGYKVPVLIQAALNESGVMRDPWGKPYLVTIRKGTIPRISLGTVQTGYYLPNFNRLTAEERGLEEKKGGK